VKEIYVYIFFLDLLSVLTFNEIATPWGFLLEDIKWTIGTQSKKAYSAIYEWHRDWTSCILLPLIFDSSCCRCMFLRAKALRDIQNNGWWEDSPKDLLQQCTDDIEIGRPTSNGNMSDLQILPIWKESHQSCFWTYNACFCWLRIFSTLTYRCYIFVVGYLTLFNL
jgi:hypothetical protein